MSNRAKEMLFCPLMEEMIEEIICFDVHMVVELFAPKWTAPKKIYETEDYETVCLNCQNHRFD